MDQVVEIARIERGALNYTTFFCSLSTSFLAQRNVATQVDRRVPPRLSPHPSTSTPHRQIVFQLLTSNHSQIPEKQSENDDGERARRQPAPQLYSSPINMSLSPPLCLEGGEPHTQEDHRARFYDNYRKVAEEYDKEFLKKHDEDLNTTLIFVSLLWRFNGHVLTGHSGGSVFRRRLRLHHRCQLSTST